MPSQKLESIEQFEEMMNGHQHVLFFKHSITCPISKAAYHEYQKFIAEFPDVDSYFLHVQEARPLSNYIAEKYGVKHESPQAIVLHNGDVQWHASHRKITFDTLNQAVLHKQ